MLATHKRTHVRTNPTHLPTHVRTHPPIHQTTHTHMRFLRRRAFFLFITFLLFIRLIDWLIRIVLVLVLVWFLILQKVDSSKVHVTYYYATTSATWRCNRLEPHKEHLVLFHRRGRIQCTATLCYTKRGMGKTNYNPVCLPQYVVGWKHWI